MKPLAFVPGVLALLLASACGYSDAQTQTGSRTSSEIDELRTALAEQGAELDALRATLAERDERIASLQRELAETTEKALRRENEILGMRRTVGGVDVEALLREMGIRIERKGQAGEPDEAEEPAEAPPPDPVATRTEEVISSIRALMRIEGVYGMDLLEGGLLQDGFTGPAVFRLLDERGRLMGSLFAQRMRCEASRAGRTVTLVLEDGYESRGGQRYPFQNGERRILLPHVDPEVWIEAAPELFAEEDAGEPRDDGTWDLVRLRLTLNELLREDAAHGYYQARHIGGVVDGVLRDVQLVDHEVDGAVERRLFADRAYLLEEAQGIQILLEDGVSVVGDRKAGFIDGRYRIYLPQARVEAWRAAELPRLLPPAGAAELPQSAGASELPQGE